MKYKKIYDVIHASGCDCIDDRSYWQKPVMSLVESFRPLWIILTNRRVNLRLWVTHENGQLLITTAQLDLNVNSKEYSDSYRRYYCTNQTEMAVRLNQILSGEISAKTKPSQEEAV